VTIFLTGRYLELTSQDGGKRRAVDQSVHSTTLDVPTGEKTPHASGVFKLKTRSIRLHQVASCCMLFDIVNIKRCTWANDEKTSTFPEVITRILFFAGIEIEGLMVSPFFG